MQTLTKQTLAVSVALAFASLSIIAVTAGCRDNNGGASSGAPTMMVLRAYDVPAGQSQELRNIVSSLMYAGENVPRLGNVVVAPTGQLLVSAPATFHEGVRELLSAVKSAPQEAPKAITIDYWIVRGAPGETKVGDDVPKAAASALEQMGGGMSLSLWDHTRITSMTNERAQVERRGANFKQTVSVQGDAAMADLDIETDVGTVRLRTALPLDSTRVLIQAADVPAGSSMASGAVFYVVRASLAQ
jgi:hypothetical protein